MLELSRTYHVYVPSADKNTPYPFDLPLSAKVADLRRELSQDKLIPETHRAVLYKVRNPIAHTGQNGTEMIIV